MALVAGAFPYDIENLLGGAVRILYADPATEVVPATIADVIEMESPYTAMSGWTDLGATRDSFTYTRGFDTEGWEIQQLSGNVIEELTDLTRTIEVSMAEFDPAHLKIIEGQQSAVETISPVAGSSAQKKISFGSFSSLSRFRFAFISQRARASGLVTESVGARTRGRFVMGVGYQAQLSADEVEFEQDKGALSAFNCGFTLFPDSDEPQGEEFGAWFFEDSGTIA